MLFIRSPEGPVPADPTVYATGTEEEWWRNATKPDESLLSSPWSMTTYTKYRADEGAVAKWLYENGFRCIPRFVRGPGQFASKGGNLPDILKQAWEECIFFVREGDKFVRATEEDVHSMAALAKLHLMIKGCRLHGKLNFPFVRSALLKLSSPDVLPPDEPNSYRAWLLHDYGTDDAKEVRQRSNGMTLRELYRRYRSCLLDDIIYFFPASLRAFYGFIHDDLELMCKEPLPYAASVKIYLDRPMFDKDLIDLAMDVKEEEYGDRERAERRILLMSDWAFTKLLERIFSDMDVVEYEEGRDRSDGTEVRETDGGGEGAECREEDPVEMHLRLRRDGRGADIRPARREPTVVRMLPQGACEGDRQGHRIGSQRF